MSVTMEAFLEKEFGIDVLVLKKLNGYENQNFYVQTPKKEFIFKTYANDKSLEDMVLAENEVLLYLQEDFKHTIPKPIPFRDKSYSKTELIDGQETSTRLLTFLEGAFLGEVDQNPAMIESLGRFLGVLDKKLKDLTHYTIQARKWVWDIQYLELVAPYLEDILDSKDRSLVQYFMLQFEENVVPFASKLRKQIIHNDANEWNVLVKENAVCGLIDFGDLAYSYRINELAVAITYVSYDKEKPLEWAALLVKAYHQAYALEEVELKVLYYLIAARLCISVCNSAHSKKQHPENTYATLSEENAWSMLKNWLQVHPLKAENTFRVSAGFAPISTPILEETLHRRLQHISPILSLSYAEPIQMVRAAFQYMYDAQGNTFLDAYNNIPHVGHSHPKVVKAASRQMARLNTNTRYLYEELAAYAEKLLSYFPAKLNRVFFVNSGSAASDLAIRLANTHTKSTHMMVMEQGYHGNTQTSIDISDYKFSHPKGTGQKDFITKVRLPDTFKGSYSGEDAGKLFGMDVINQIQEISTPISAFITEPIVGCAGQIPLPKGYLKEVYPAIHAQGGLCISDEVQTGFGRLGHYFWGYEAQDVTPDIVILGKPIANGHPMGAVVCTEEIAASFEKGVEFFSSFGGNPVSCAIAAAVLEVIEEENLQENAKEVGDYYQELLRGLQAKFPCIGDVRGMGLFLGCEIVKDYTTLPDTALASHIKNELRRNHILISTDGPFNNVLKTKPPLCFTKENAEMVLEVMEKVLAAHYS